jgi:hypothetical protein
MSSSYVYNAWDLHDVIVVLQVTPIFSMEDDPFAESFEIQTKYDSELAMEIPYLLSVNQLLESVCQPIRPLLFSVNCFKEYQCKDGQIENGFLST